MILQLDAIIAAFGTLVTILVILAIVLLMVNGIFLGIALGFVNGKNRELGDTFMTSLLICVSSLIPCLGCILGLYFIKTRHDIGWGGAIIAYILTALIAIVVVFAILLIFFLPLLVTLFGLFSLPIPITIPTP